MDSWKERKMPQERAEVAMSRGTVATGRKRAERREERERVEVRSWCVQT
jgi:hypothetical protein